MPFKAGQLIIDEEQTCLQMFKFEATKFSGKILPTTFFLLDMFA